MYGLTILTSDLINPINRFSPLLPHSEEAQLSEPDETAKLTVTAHSLAAHFTTLDQDALARAAAKLWADCRLWLARLFRWAGLLLLQGYKLFSIMLNSVFFV